ncbi:zinc finger MYM-type protein 6-like [Eurosta solidaginis]|uniref:zinc finger MYM-type protein 6-like n=1 Tax=Eurosta solidaginis TaxID=178769 RepID=UPI00353090F0
MDKFVVRQKKAESSSCGNDDCVEKEEPVPNQSEKTTLRRKFRVEWAEKFSWLEEKQEKSYCNICEKFLMNHFSYLTKHSKKQSHIQLEKQKKNQLKIDSYKGGEQVNLCRQVGNAEQILAMFTVKHNLPFLLMDSLPNLLRECCPDSSTAKALKCGRTKTTQIVEQLGSKAINHIRCTMRCSKFSLIVDETTDISTRKCLVLLVRYFDRISRTINDRFLTLIELVQADAESIYQSIKSFLDDNNIPLENLIGLATDGASKMAGELNGLKTKFGKDTIFILS